MRRCNSSYSILLATCFVFTVLTALTACKDAPAPVSGQVAPTISCNDIAGEYVSLSQLKKKVVVLYFWSSKCCGDNLKKLEPFYQQQKYNGLSLLAIEVGGSQESVASFVKNNKLTFTNVADEYETFSKSYRVIGFPTIFVIDKNGVIRKKVSGDLPTDQLTKLVAPFL